MRKSEEAVCVRDCYDSTTGQIYEKDKTYLVDPTNPWVQKHFLFKEKIKTRDEEAVETDKPEPARGRPKKE